MTQSIKRASALILFLTVLMTTSSELTRAADCTSFMNLCHVWGMGNQFVFDCDTGISCGEIDACVAEACPQGGGTICGEGCGSGGGPCGAGVCYE